MIRINNMNKLLKNKVAVASVIAVVILAAVFFVVRGMQKTKSVPIASTSPEEQAITMKPQDIGLSLIPSSNNTEVEMKISDVSKFNSFDYEMNYTAIVNGQSVPRGVIGSGNIKSGETSVDRKITIGTCSSGTCKYDKGVSKITFIIRLNLINGKTGVVTKDITLKTQ